MLRVLIVEDEQPIRELLSDFLSSEGYTTLVAENGLRGIEMAQSAQPDLVLMDLMLPILDGFSAMRALRSHPETCDIPVVLMSANSLLLMRVQKQARVVDTLRKPFDLDRVLSVVQSKIGLGASRRYAEALWA